MTSQPGRAPTIMIVEDEFIIRDTLTEFLEDEGYHIVGAAHGQEALEYLQTADPPALILLDLRMPVMNGLQFIAAQHCDPTLAAIPVILMSADRTDQREVADGQVAGHLEKPIRLTDILDVVEQHTHAGSGQPAHH